MSRPLIIKVDSHKSQPSKKATGSIDMQLLKGFNTKGNIATTNSEIDNSSIINVVKEDQYNPPEESGSQSIVRSLISRYETSPEQANLIKYKSKSMVDLQKPQISMVTTKTTQDDSLYNKGKYNDGAENQKFDFKKVFLKFETSSQSGPKRSNVTNHSINHFKNKMSPHNNDSLDLVSLKQKAKTLLEQYEQDHDYSNWQNKVLELLQQISGSHEMPQVVKPSYFNKSIKIETSPSMYKLERTETAKEVELSTNRKVRDIKNLFENNNDDVKPFSRSVSSYATYFGVDEDSIYLNRAAYSNRSISATPFNDDYNNNEMEKEKSEESEMSENDSEAIEGKRTVTQPIPASSMKIQELKNFFESDPDKYVPYGSYIENDQPEQSDMASNTFNISETDDVQVVENRILPPLKMFVLEEETDRHVDIEDSKQRLEDLTKDIEDCEQQIKTLSETNKEEGTYINELLIRVLLKLDGIKTYGNDFLLTERRKAIQFCTNCISKLGDKVKGK